MTKSKFLRAVVGVAAISALALGSVACADDGGETDTGTETTTTTGGETTTTGGESPAGTESPTS